MGMGHRMAGSPEHNLQVQIKKWARECIAEPHVFLAFDRSRARGDFTHAREAARGLRRGTPDTVLMFRARWMWVELKAGKNTTSDAQDLLHGEMSAIGHNVRVCWSVTDYWRCCVAEGVKMVQWAEARADGLDALLTGEGLPKAKSAKPRQPRTKRPSSKAIAISTRYQMP